jgi:hypothetical protein
MGNKVNNFLNEVKLIKKIDLYFIVHQFNRLFYEFFHHHYFNLIIFINYFNKNISSLLNIFVFI